MHQCCRADTKIFNSLTTPVFQFLSSIPRCLSLWSSLPMPAKKPSRSGSAEISRKTKLTPARYKLAGPEPRAWAQKLLYYTAWTVKETTSASRVGTFGSQWTSPLDPGTSRGAPIHETSFWLCFKVQLAISDSLESTFRHSVAWNVIMS